MSYTAALDAQDEAQDDSTAQPTASMAVEVGLQPEQDDAGAASFTEVVPVSDRVGEGMPAPKQRSKSQGPLTQFGGASSDWNWSATADVNAEPPDPPPKVVGSVAEDSRWNWDGTKTDAAKRTSSMPADSRNVKKSRGSDDTAPSTNPAADPVSGVVPMFCSDWECWNRGEQTCIICMDFWCAWHWHEDTGQCRSCHQKVVNIVEEIRLKDARSSTAPTVEPAPTSSDVKMEAAPSDVDVDATSSGKGATAGYPDGSVGVPPVKPKPLQQATYSGVAAAMEESPLAKNPVLYTEVERTLKEATIRVKEEATDKRELGDSDEEQAAEVQLKEPLSNKQLEELEAREEANWSHECWAS